MSVPYDGAGIRILLRFENAAHALARALVAMKSLVSNSCSMMCGRPSQQTRKREIACVRNRLFSLARIASKESQRATKVTSGDSDLPEAKATIPRYPPCSRASSTSEARISRKSYAPFFLFAQRAFCAMEIRFRPAAVNLPRLVPLAPRFAPFSKASIKCSILAISVFRW